MIYVRRDLRCSPPRMTVWIAPDRPPVDFNPEVTTPRDPERGIIVGWWIATMIVSVLSWIGIGLIIKAVL